MTQFHFRGIAHDLAAEVRRTMRSPQYGHPAHRELAQGTGPCRHCLRTFAVGEEQRILFTYQPFSDEGSLPSPGPIFIHADGCERYDAPACPPDFRSLPLVVDAYARGGRPVGQERTPGAAVEDALARVFARTGADYVHLRHGEAGCFITRVDAR